MRRLAFLAAASLGLGVATFNQPASFTAAAKAATQAELDAFRAELAAVMATAEAEVQAIDVASRAEIAAVQDAAIAEAEAIQQTYIDRLERQ